MQYSKQMYLVSPEEYLALKAQGKASDLIDLNKHNTTMIQNQVLQKNQKDKSWKDYGTEMEKVIAQGIDESDLHKRTTSPQNLSTSFTIAPTGSNHELSFIRENIAAKMVNKVAQFYNMLKTIPEVQIRENNMTVDGAPQQGTTLEILRNLVYKQKFLKYAVTPLLKYIASYPDLVKMIGNTEAQEILKKMRNGQRETGTVSQNPSLDFTLDETNQDESFNQEPSATSTPIPRSKKKGGKKRKEKKEERKGEKKIKWISIF